MTTFVIREWVLGIVWNDYDVDLSLWGDTDKTLLFNLLHSPPDKTSDTITL